MSKPALPAPLDALLEPRAYPHPVDGVRVIQTHISYVFLAGEYVYKVKKPVDFGFLNYTTLRRRRYYCGREVELNAPLAPGVYLGVVRVARGRDGAVAVEGEGRTVEYAVKMRRLPADRFMDHLAREGRLDPEVVDRVAERLAAFHASARRGGEIDRYGRRATIRANWEENFEQCGPYVGRTVTAEQLEAVRRWAFGVLEGHPRLFDLRVREGRIRDCHGDLRGDSVCVTEPLAIIDRIEFNRRFRYGDAASDAAFLAMDLEFQGQPALAERFVRRYAEAAADPGCLLVMDFYRAYRAWVRGKVESFKLDEPEVEEADREASAARARRYFALAAAYAGRRRRPFLAVTTGLVATGKSTLARAVAEPLAAAVIRSDVVRKELAGLSPWERRLEAFGQGLYRPEVTEAVYGALLERAEALLASGRSVVLDASFPERRWREAARAVARRMGVPFLCMYTQAGEDEVRRRLAARPADPTNVSDARWETFLSQRERFEPPDELPRDEVAAVDAERPLEAGRDAVLWALVPRLVARPSAPGRAGAGQGARGDA